MTKISFKKRFDVGVVIKNLEMAKMPQGYNAMAYDYWRSVLKTTLDFDGCDEFTIDYAIRKSLTDPELYRNYCPAEFLKLVNAHYKARIREPTEQHYYATNFTLPGHPPLSWTLWSGSRVEFNPSPSTRLQKAIRNARQELLKKNQSVYKPPSSACSLTEVRIKLGAHTPFQAFEKANLIATEIRGVLNILVNQQVNSQRSLGAPRPFNAILDGPYMTIHDSEGAIPINSFWWQEDWPVRNHDSGTRQRYEKHLDLFVKYRNGLLKGNKLRSEASRSLTLYCQALDNSKKSNAFLELWTALEYLTNTQSDSYEVTVRRASRLFENSKEMLEVANHLRHRRNRLVHRFGKEGNGEAEILVHQLRIFVEPLIVFYITNPYRLVSRQEVGEFFDQPPVRDSAIRKRKIADDWIKYCRWH